MYRIIRQVTSLGFAGYACTVMAIREDSAGQNEFGVRVCPTLEQARRAADILDVDIRQRILARGDDVIGIDPPHRALAHRRR